MMYAEQQNKSDNNFIMFRAGKLDKENKRKIKNVSIYWQGNRKRKLNTTNPLGFPRRQGRLLIFDFFVFIGIVAINF